MMAVGIRSKKLAWQRETALPSGEDEWHCDCIREEWRGAKPEIFLRAENNILTQLRKSADV
jgi:hypothetical protein